MFVGRFSVPFQDPERINDAMLDVFSQFQNFRFELGINVNHPIEFWDEHLNFENSAVWLWPNNTDQAINNLSTILPDIPYLTTLLTMIFAPKIKLIPEEDNSRYWAIKINLFCAI